jgi:hypothetical protein
VCELIDMTLGHLVGEVCEPYEDMDYYESNVEARVIFFSMARHLDAVLTCARTEAALIPSAYTLSRAVLEMEVKLRWMLLPSDPFDREARFLAHLSDEERMWERHARDSGDSSGLERSNALMEFRSNVESALPKHIARLSRIPSLYNMLVEIGERQRYAVYTLLSQFVHGSHHAGSLYRKNLGTMKVIREEISSSMWATPLAECWRGVLNSGVVLVRACAGRDLQLVRSSDLVAIKGLLRELSSNPA